MDVYFISAVHPECEATGRPVILRNDSLVSYAEGITGICETHKVTSGQLGRVLGLSGRLVEKWRSGERYPTGKSLYALRAWLEERS
jgi:DNA-binding transcriptional regulator YiaG